MNPSWILSQWKHTVLLLFNQMKTECSQMLTRSNLKRFRLKKKKHIEKMMEKYKALQRTSYIKFSLRERR